MGRLHLSETRRLIGPRLVGVAGWDDDCDWGVSGLETDVIIDCGGITRGGSPDVTERGAVADNPEGNGRPAVTGGMVVKETGDKCGLGDETGSDGGFEGLPTGDVIFGDVICEQKVHIYL